MNCQVIMEAFKIFRPKKTDISSTIETLEKSLKEIKIRKKPAEVEIISIKNSPPGLPALISPIEAKKLGCHIIGIEVSPVYLDEETDQVFPIDSSQA